MSKQEYLLSPSTFIEKKGPIKRWSYPMGLFSYVLSQLSDSQVESKANIAWEVDKYWLQRRSPNALKTIKLLVKLLEASSSMYPHLSQQGEVLLNKQQPSLIEAIRETILRLKFLSLFTLSLPHPVLSCISGGSMSYGRFYNVRGGEDPSDLDLIIVYENGSEDILNAESIMPRNLGFCEDDILLMHERIRKFTELASVGQAQVLSQKSAIIDQGFDVSMHVMSRATFYDQTIFGVFADLKAGFDVDRRILDYKPVPFKHSIMRQRDFMGGVHVFDAIEERLIDGVGQNEVVSQIPAYSIRRGYFIPGMYQNLVAPRFEFEPFTSPTVSSAVTMYWSMMHDLQAVYRRTCPDASVIKSHIRYDLFSPKLRKFYE